MELQQEIPSRFDVPSQPSTDACQSVVSPDGKHAVDESHVALNYDGGQFYVDVYCTYCGHSGCIAAIDIEADPVDWE